MCILSIFGGAFIGYRLFQRPTKIEFRVSAFDSFGYAFNMFFTITAVMVLELSLDQWVLSLKPQDIWLKYLCRAIDGGVLVGIAIPCMSLLFGKRLIDLKLDLSRGYSIDFLKKYYSIVILANCLWFMAIAKPYVAVDTSEAQTIISRVVIWLLNVVGTWAGIGFHCEGRIDEELNNIKISKDNKNRQDKLNYCKPYLIAFLLNSTLLVVQLYNVSWMRKLFFVLYAVGMSGLFGMLVCVWILRYVEIPNEKRSDKVLAEAISDSHSKSQRIISRRYRSLQYSLITRENAKYIRIHSQKVLWEGHSEEIQELFGEREKQVEAFGFEECKEYLIEIRKKRKQYVDDGFKQCEQEAKKEIIRRNL